MSQNKATEPSEFGVKPTTSSPSEVFRVFLKLGLTSFGGPVAHLGYYRDELVVRRKWIDEAGYADLVALSGPNFSSFAAYLRSVCSLTIMSFLPGIPSESKHRSYRVHNLLYSSPDSYIWSKNRKRTALIRKISDFFRINFGCVFLFLIFIQS